MNQPLHTPAETAAHTGPRNGLGVAALILGIVALITSPLLVGLLFGSFAVTLGLSGLENVSRNQATNRRTTIAGAVLGVVAIVISLVALVFKLCWLF